MFDLRKTSKQLNRSVSEFNELKPRFKSPKNRFQLSADLNLEKLNTILSGTAIFEPRLKFKPRLKFYKFGLGSIFWQLMHITGFWTEFEKMSEKMFANIYYLLKRTNIKRKSVKLFVNCKV